MYFMRSNEDNNTSKESTMSQRLNHYGCDVCGDTNQDDDYTPSQCDECADFFCPEDGFSGTDSVGGDVSICGPCADKSAERAREDEEAYYASGAWEAWQPEEDLPF